MEEYLNDVLQLALSMFGATPGTTYLPAFTGYLEAPGSTIVDQANLLAASALFQSAEFYPDSLDIGELTALFVDNLVGDTVSEANKEWAAGVLETQLLSGESVGDVIWGATSVLDAVSWEDPNWGRAAAQFDNRVDVSTVYVEVGGNAVDLATLQGLVSDITDDQQTAENAIQILQEYYPDEEWTF